MLCLGNTSAIDFTNYQFKICSGLATDVEQDNLHQFLQEEDFGDFWRQPDAARRLVEHLQSRVSSDFLCKVYIFEHSSLCIFIILSICATVVEI